MANEENKKLKSDPSDEKELDFLVSIASLKVVYCLITQKKLKSLDETLQTYAASANAELVREAGITIDGVKDEVFIFTSDKTFLQGASFLNVKVPKFKDVKFTSICVPTALFFETLREKDPRVLHINLGSPNAKRYGQDKIAEIASLGDLVRIAHLPSLFIVQDQNKYALPMELEGQNYALAFIEEADGLKTLEGLRKEGNPGVQLEWNKLEVLVQNVVNSEFSGLLINPASDSQAVLSKESLKQLLQIIKSLKGPSLFSKKALKDLFSLHPRD